MRVFYDHQVFSVQQHGGISRYFAELIKALYQVPGFTAVSGLVFSNNTYLHDAGFFPVRKFFPGQEFRGKNTLLWSLNKVFGHIKMQRSGYDLMHPTYFNPGGLPAKGRKPMVVTFHDMIYERFPGIFPVNDPLISWKKEMAKRADRIIAVSRATRDDLVGMLGVDERKVEVVYHGNSLWPDKQDRSAADGPAWPQRFILFVGRRDGHKNFHRFAKVMAILFKKQPDLMLVCAGGGRFTASERSWLKLLEMDSRVVQKDCNDKELADAYSHALCLVFPSLYEGFGMPLLEAFACGCPVVCSNAGSLPEIAADAASYFDPLSESDMLATVEMTIDNKGLADALSMKGKVRVKEFSWSRSANKTHKVYEELL